MESLQRSDQEAVTGVPTNGVSHQTEGNPVENPATADGSTGDKAGRMKNGAEFSTSGELIERLGNQNGLAHYTNGDAKSSVNGKGVNGFHTNGKAESLSPLTVPFSGIPSQQPAADADESEAASANGESADQKTLRERIVDGLREAIVLGEIAPGARLQEVEIAERYHTSRTPVREAFRQLESEGFVRIRARRGAVVTSMTPKDVREFYDIKSVLEGYAARCAAARLSDREIDRMEKLNRELGQCYEQGNVARIVQVHNEFHEVFVRACGNDRLVQLITGLVQQFQRFRIALSHTDAVRDSVEVHDEIIAAFRARDAQRAEELAAKNSLQGSESLIQGLLATAASD